MDVFRKVTEMSIGLAVLMIVLGFLAITLPLATGIGVSILVGWIVVFGGFTYVAYAFSAEGAGAFLWRMLIGIVYVVGGFYLVFHPGLALESLTLVLGWAIGTLVGINLLVSGFTRLMYSIEARKALKATA